MCQSRQKSLGLGIRPPVSQRKDLERGPGVSVAFASDGVLEDHTIAKQYDTIDIPISSHEVKYLGVSSSLVHEILECRGTKIE